MTNACMTREPLHAYPPAITHTCSTHPRQRAHPPTVGAALQERIHHQPIAPTVSCSVRAKCVVPPAYRLPRIAGRRPARLSVAR
jgi:hypothetical protein